MQQATRKKGRKPRLTTDDQMKRNSFVLGDAGYCLAPVGR
jgi:hypothetical protein